MSASTPCPTATPVLTLVFESHIPADYPFQPLYDRPGPLKTTTGQAVYIRILDAVGLVRHYLLLQYDGPVTPTPTPTLWL